MADWLTPEQRSRNMAAIRSEGTKLEFGLSQLLSEMFPRRRQILHADLPGKPDVYLPGLRLAVFADGCFWHGCPKHGRTPKDNPNYWGPKLARNSARDRETVRELRNRGLIAVRIWEHEIKDVRSARKKVQRAIRGADPR